MEASTVRSVETKPAVTEDGKSNGRSVAAQPTETSGRAADTPPAPKRFKFPTAPTVLAIILAVVLDLAWKWRRGPLPEPAS